MKLSQHSKVKLTHLLIRMVCISVGLLTSPSYATVHCNNGHPELCAPHPTNHNVPPSQQTNTSNQINSGQTNGGTIGTIGTIVLPPAPIEGPKPDPVRVNLPPPERTTSLEAPYVAPTSIQAVTPSTLMMNTPKVGKVAPPSKLGPIEPSIPDGPKADPVAANLPLPQTSTNEVGTPIVPAVIDTINSPPLVLVPQIPPVQVVTGTLPPPIVGYAPFTGSIPVPKPFVIPMTTPQGSVPPIPVVTGIQAPSGPQNVSGSTYDFHLSRPIPNRSKVSTPSKLGPVDTPKNLEPKTPPLNVFSGKAEDHKALNSTMITQKPGRQNPSNLPAFTVADAQGSRECVVSGFYRRKTVQSNGGESYQGSLPNWRMVMPEVADIPAWHPLESGCLVSIGHRKVN